MSARVRLGAGEHLIFVGHDVAIVVPSDDPVAPSGVYFAADWNAECAPSAVLDVDGDVAYLDGFGKPYRWVTPRSPRCPSERKRAERIFARDFGDQLRVGGAP